MQRVEKFSDQDLIIILSNGLGMALEMSYDSRELKKLWGDELEALRQASTRLRALGVEPPEVIQNVLSLAER